MNDFGVPCTLQRIQNEHSHSFQKLKLIMHYLILKYLWELIKHGTSPVTEMLCSSLPGLLIPPQYHTSLHYVLPNGLKRCANGLDVVQTFWKGYTLPERARTSRLLKLLKSSGEPFILILFVMNLFTVLITDKCVNTCFHCWAALVYFYFVLVIILVLLLIVCGL